MARDLVLVNLKDGVQGSIAIRWNVFLSVSFYFSLLARIRLTFDNSLAQRFLPRYECWKDADH